MLENIQKIIAVILIRITFIVLPKGLFKREFKKLIVYWLSEL